MIDNRTTELREKLTERGVAYRTTEVHGMPVTLFNNGILTWSVTDHPDGYMIVNCGGLTPEQAIAATLGSSMLTAEQVMSIARKHQPDYCSDTHVCFDWQAIADELNATLRSETSK